MAAAVALIEGGQVRADLVACEVFELDRIGEAMGLLGRSDPLGKALTDEWRDHADDMEVERVEGASHFLPEEKPEVVLERALRFLP